MSFFTIGNLLTLGIVAAVLILYRQLDKNNRSMDKVRKYGEKLKEELSVFITEKESAVRDYAIELDIQQKAAKELMNRLILTDEGMTEKTEALVRIDERISAYDKALDDLMKMTSRVEENLERIRDESDFVESSAKKITEAKGRLIDLEKNLSDIEFRFERDNADALERTMQAAIAAVRSTVSDMQASAETIERQVEDHREAVTKIEQQRAANLARDTDTINKLLREAVEKAGSKADKLEDTALVKLKEQALERVRRFKEEIEEKIKVLQETAKVRIHEVQGFVKSYKEEWKTESGEIEARQKLYKDEWKKDVQELTILAKNQKEEWKKTASETDAEMRSTFDALNTEIIELQKKADESLVLVHGEIEAKQKLFEDEWKKDVEGLNTLAENQKEEWKKIAAETDAAMCSTLDALNIAAASLQKKADESLALVHSEIGAKQKSFENEWKKDVEDLHRLAENQKEAWEKIAAETDAAMYSTLDALNTAIAGLQKKADESLALVHSEIEAKQKLFENEWKKDAEDLHRLAENQKEAWGKNAAEMNAELRTNIDGLNVLIENQKEAWKKIVLATDAELRTSIDDVNASIADMQKKADESLALVHSEIGAKQKRYENEWKKDVEDLNVLAENQKEVWEKIAAETDAELRTNIDGLNVLVENQKEAWKKIVLATDAELRTSIDDVNASIADMQKKADESLALVHSEIGAKQKRYENEWKKDVEDLNRLAETQKEAWKNIAAETDADMHSSLEALNTEIMELQKKVDGSIASIDKRIEKTAETAEQKALEAAESKLEAYRTAQNEEFKRLESLSDDIVQLDAELRRYMQETEKRVRSDFAFFEKESADARNSSAALFASSLAALKTDIDSLEQELNALKNRAYENVSEKLKLFEDDFTTDLTKRSEAVDQRLDEWQIGFDASLQEISESSAAERKILEQNFTETLKSRFADSDERVLTELEHLKAKTNAFEEGIREQMTQADQSLESLREQLRRELEEARIGASSMVKSEISRHELSMAELFKHTQRNLESTVKDLEIQFADWKSNFSAQLHEADESLDETKRKTRDIANETENHRAEIFSRTEEQISGLETKIKDADRQIKEFINQTKLFDQAEKLKTELERSIEDLKAEMSRLDHQKTEIKEMETEFAKIKRLEDEVNAKMTRFLSEKRRIELMEADFNRLLTTSQAVEEKLVQVSGEDDALQSMQVQLRHLYDALSDTEEKYQRIEKKNQTLENTNDSIDRNFKLLQETEGKVKHVDESIVRMQSSMENIQYVLGSLTRDNEKVYLAQEKLSELDGTLVDIEKRIESMQVAREWLARTESRLAEVSKQAQDYVKLLGDLIKGESKKGMPQDRGAPPIGTRETVAKLAHQGWKVDEIARAVGLSKGEVELILEISPKD